MLSSLFVTLVATTSLVAAHSGSPATSSICNGKAYEYLGLAGYGFTPSNSRDKFNETAGGLGSSSVIDPQSWTLQSNGSYTGLLYALPDRGWNTQGTLNYQPRVHKFHIVFDPQSSGPATNLQLYYVDTVRFSAGDTPFTGLDPKPTGPYMEFNGVTLPSATYEGDGFGLPGDGGHRPSLDSEGLVVNSDGTMFVSDEYGDYVYHFDAQGNLLAAFPPPHAFIPTRNSSVSFSANSPPRYDQNLTVSPKNPTSGRANNQGLEGLTASADGKFLYALTQSALIQDGGKQGDQFRRWARLVKMAVDASGQSLKVVAQYVVPLPIYTDANGNQKTAGQSEIKFISETQFLVLSRDSGAGHGQELSQSVYRHADVFDISNATDVNGREIVAPKGVLDTNITSATYCSFLDYNDNQQLAKFNLHNGGAQDNDLLNEKWESFSLVPVIPSIRSRHWSRDTKSASVSGNEYFLFSLSDNDFITQDGSMDSGRLPYSDESGYDLRNQVLVFRIRLPSDAQPRIG